MTRQELLVALADRVAAVRLPHPVRVAIDGLDAAGKTTLADALATAVAQFGRPVIRASVDGFHNPAAVRRRRAPLSPQGYFYDSFNYAALLNSLLEPLGPHGSREFRRAVFDFRTDEAVDSPLERAAPNAVLLLDGVFLLRPELRAHFDLSIFVRADFGVIVARAERRDLDLFGSAREVRRRYARRYVPGQRLYLSSADPERWASIVIDNNDPEHPEIIRSSVLVRSSRDSGSGREPKD